MTVKPFAIATAGLLALTAPVQVSAQDNAETTTTVQREDEGFNLGWLGLLGLAGLLGLKRRENRVTPSSTTTSRV